MYRKITQNVDLQRDLLAEITLFCFVTHFKTILNVIRHDKNKRCRTIKKLADISQYDAGL